jgi:putative inorganic carbon (hco3(-)) transporter
LFKKASIPLFLFYAASIFFMLLNLYYIVKKDSLYINALPVALFIVLMAIFSLEKLIYLVVFFTPLSLPLRSLIPGLSFDMFLPTEPLLFGIMLVLILKIVMDRGFDRKILCHPVTLAIFFNLVWVLVTCFTSTMPLVSFKFFLARCWFLAAFYFIAIKLFEKGENTEKYVWLYVLPLIGVIFYSTFRHLGYGLWDKDAAHFVVEPFYNDHTSYGALTAFYIPFLFGFAFYREGPRWIKIAARIALPIVIGGFILSYSRAAWVSMLIAFIVWGIIKLRIRFQPLFITFLTLLALFLLFQTQIVMYLERNSDESSANMLEHVSSVSNITTDASNMERLNRWSCAFRMFREKPVFGYGPGTYMFQYAPFQLTKDRTIISTNAADAGNAHSEYLGPLAESGVLGTLSFLLIIILVIYTAIHSYTRTHDQRLKLILLGALSGLITYYIHGFMNNFLDTDKASVPFWGFTAMIVAIDIYTRKQLADQKTGTTDPV